MVMKETKNLVEVIGKEIEIFKTKMLLFIAISGGSWVYVFKLDKLVLISLLLFTFVISSYGIFSNLLKLSDLQKELSKLKGKG